MFTLEQIIQAHSKVKSGSDFPNYFREIKQLGVIYYETFVSDGHTDYFGNNGYQISSPPKYASQVVANKSDPIQFRLDLVAHQQGKTDYPTFCNDCARSGVYRWIVRMENMTCTYFDAEGNEMLREVIPS